MSSPHCKAARKHDYNNTITFNAMDYNTNEHIFAKYFVMSSADSPQPITTASPFHISKVLQDIVEGKFNNITKLASGFLLIECANQCLISTGTCLLF